MTLRRTKFVETSPIESLLLREQMGFSRYRKTGERDSEKRRILIELALEKIRETELTDYILVGEHRRRLQG
jgi:hypothetical protein